MITQLTEDIKMFVRDETYSCCVRVKLDESGDFDSLPVVYRVTYCLWPEWYGFSGFDGSLVVWTSEGLCGMYSTKLVPYIADFHRRLSTEVQNAIDRS